MILTVIRAAPSGRGRGRVGAPDASAALDGLYEFCRTLHLVNSRDVDGTVTEVVRAMVTHGRGSPVGSSRLAAATRINRVTIIHHLRRLEEAGVVVRQDHKYALRARGFGELVDQMRRAQLQMLARAELLADALDRDYGLVSMPRTHRSLVSHDLLPVEREAHAAIIVLPSHSPHTGFRAPASTASRPRANASPARAARRPASGKASAQKHPRRR